MTQDETLARIKLRPLLREGTIGGIVERGRYILQYKSPTGGVIVAFEVTPATIRNRAELLEAFFKAGIMEREVPLPKRETAYIEWSRALLAKLSRKKWSAYQSLIVEILQGLPLGPGVCASDEIKAGFCFQTNKKQYVSPTAFLARCQEANPHITNRDTSKVFVDMGWHRSSVYNKPDRKTHPAWARVLFDTDTRPPQVQVWQDGLDAAKEAAAARENAYIDDPTNPLVNHGLIFASRPKRAALSASERAATDLLVEQEWEDEHPPFKVDGASLHETEVDYETIDLEFE